MSLVMIVENREDDSLNLQRILLRFQKGITFAVLQNTEDALEYIKLSRQKVDIFFISLDLPEKEGYQFAYELTNSIEYHLAPIIFMTDSNVDKLDIYKSFHCYGIIGKNHIEEYVEHSLKILFDTVRIKNGENNFERSRRMMSVETREIESLIPVEDIISLEVYGNRCIVYTEKQKYQLGRGTLEERLKEIGNPDIIRCHKSYGVNVRYIKGWKKKDRNIWEPIFYRDINVPCLISRTYYYDVREQYIKAIQYDKVAEELK